MKQTRSNLATCGQFMLLVLCLSFSTDVFGQDGISGINEANTRVRSYFEAGTKLMYAVGAMLALIGATKV